MNFNTSKVQGFPVIMATYASANTDHSYEYFYDLFADDGESWLKYLLWTALPSEYTFDGVKEVCLREESENHIGLVATFWFLTEGGSCLVSAFQFAAECLDDNIEFEYSILPHDRFEWLVDSGKPICKGLAECVWPISERGSLNG